MRKRKNKASLDNFNFFEDFDRLMSLVLDKLIDITQKELIKTKCCWKTKKTIEIQQQER
jgi:hypothetical protein